MATAAKLSPHDERRVAVEAGVDPRTVRALLAGRAVRSTTAARITKTLASLGIATTPVAPEDSTTVGPTSAKVEPQ